MGLVPAEREALARIESQLRESDPQLAVMLQAFGRPCGQPQETQPQETQPQEAQPQEARPQEARTQASPRGSQSRRLRALVVTVAVMLVALWGITLSALSGKPPPRGLRERPNVPARFQGTRSGAPARQLTRQRQPGAPVRCDRQPRALPCVWQRTVDSRCAPAAGHHSQRNCGRS
jgi:hypothetical protein